jgi:hypothetical protein
MQTRRATDHGFTECHSIVMLASHSFLHRISSKSISESKIQIEIEKKAFFFQFFFRLTGRLETVIDHKTKN